MPEKVSTLMALFIFLALTHWRRVVWQASLRQN